MHVQHHGIYIGAILPQKNSFLVSLSLSLPSSLSLSLSLFALRLSFSSLPPLSLFLPLPPSLPLSYFAKTETVGLGWGIVLHNTTPHCTCCYVITCTHKIHQLHNNITMPRVTANLAEPTQDYCVYTNKGDTIHCVTIDTHLYLVAGRINYK